MREKNSQSRLGAPIQKPLKFFRMNCNDDLIEELQLRFGHIAVTFFVRIQDQIYGKEGYYFEANAEDEQSWGFSLRKMMFETKERYKLRGILHFLIDKDFFDKQSYEEKKILTSVHIQRFYFWATKRRLLAEFKKEYFLPGTEEFIKEVRKISDKDEEKIEQLIENGDGLWEAVNQIVQNRENEVSAIPVHNNSDNADNNQINDNIIQTKETKGKEKKPFGVSENSPEFSSNVSLSAGAASDKSDGKKPKTSPEHRKAIMDDWSEWTKKTFVPTCVEDNVNVNGVIAKVRAEAENYLRKHQVAPEMWPDKLLPIMRVIWKSIFDDARWDKMPPTLNSHKDFKMLHKRWDSLTTWKQKPQSKPKNPAKNETQPKDQRTNGTHSLAELLAAQQKKTET